MVAQPSGFAVLHHLAPTSAVVHHQYASAGHRFKAHSRPVFRRVRGLKHYFTVLVEVLLAHLPLVARRAYPPVGLSDFLPAPLVEAQKQATLEERGDEVFVDVERVGGEFVRVLPGDAPAAEVFPASLGDEGEGVVVEVGLEGEEGDGRIVVAALEQGHVFLADFFVLVEEHGNHALLHEFLFLVEEPGHAVDEDGAPGFLADGGEVFQVFAVAESDDGIAFFQNGPVVGSVDMDAQPDHVQIEDFVLEAVVGGDDVDVNVHVFPDQDLVVEFGSRSAVEAGEAVDIDFL